MNFKHLLLTLSMTAILTTSFFTIQAQTPRACSDLIVSEVKFGKEVDSLGNITAINHSVELFNTTDTDIDLSLYTLELVPDSGAPTVMGLSGIIPTHGTHVLTNVNSSQGIIALADAVELLLLFDGKVSIELRKGNLVKDKIGKEGVSNLAIDIDLNQLIADPIGYLQNAEIDLGSIEGLTIKRRPIVQQGKNTFSTQDFIDEWNAYPESFSQGLGEHANACVAPVVTFSYPNSQYVEGQSGELLATLSGSDPDLVDVWIVDDNLFTNCAPNPWANAGDFWHTVPWFQWFPGESGEKSIIVETFEDSFVEGDEHVCIKFDAFFSSPNMILSPSPHQMKIIDNDFTGIQEQNIDVVGVEYATDNSIHVLLNGRFAEPVIWLFDGAGRLVFSEQSEDQNTYILMPSKLSKGFYLLGVVGLNKTGYAKIVVR